MGVRTAVFRPWLIPPECRYGRHTGNISSFDARIISISPAAT